uniref:Golgin-84 n=2 Tax=Macrostomum lignano TaxID=282301 RepID=A0A1I8FY97_9PLAT
FQLELKQQQSAALAASQLLQLRCKHPVRAQQVQQSNVISSQLDSLDQVESLRSEIATLRANCSELTHKLGQLEASSAIVNETAHCLDNDLATVKAATDAELARVSQLDREKSLATAAVNSAAWLRGELQRLRSRLAKTESVEQELKTLRIEASESGSLRRQLSHAVESVNAEQTRCRRLEADRTRLLGDSADSSESIDNLKRSLESTQSMLSEQRRLTCRTQLEAQQLTIRLAESVEPEVQKLRSDMRRLRERRDELLAEQQQAQILSNMAAADSNATPYSSDISIAASTAAQQQAEAEPAAVSNEELERDILQTKLRCDQLEASVADSDSATKTLCCTLDQLDAVIKRLRLTTPADNISVSLRTNSSTALGRRWTPTVLLGGNWGGVADGRDTPGSRFMARQRQRQRVDGGAK